MKTITKIILFGLLVVATAFLIIKATKNTSNKNLTHSKTAYSLPSNQLITAYLNNQKTFEKKYVGKIIEVEGIVEDVNTINNTITILLKTGLENYGVICDMNQQFFDITKPIATGNKIRIKGVCKGILKDVILQNCIII